MTLRIFFEALPQGERDEARHMAGLLSHFTFYLNQFECALKLHDYCLWVKQQMRLERDREPDAHKQIAIMRRQESSMPVLAWANIASKESAMAVYHFGCLLDAISFKRCASIRPMIDHKSLKRARKIFGGRFHDVRPVRHVISHAAEFASARGSIHQFKGNYSSPNLRIAGGGVTISNWSDGRKLTSTWTDPHTGITRVVTTECSAATLQTLTTVFDLVLEAFRSAEAQTQEIVSERFRLSRARARIVAALRQRSAPD